MEEGIVFDSDGLEQLFADPPGQFFWENPAISAPTVQHGTARKRPYSETLSSGGGTQTTRDVDVISAEEKRLRRKSANRISARRSRQNKREFVNELQQEIAAMHQANEDLRVKYEALARNTEQVFEENMAFKAQIKEMHVSLEDLKAINEALRRNNEQVLVENMTFKAQIKEMDIAYEDLKVKHEALGRNYEQVLTENMTFKTQVIDAEKRNEDGEMMSTPMPTNQNHIQKFAYRLS